MSDQGGLKDIDWCEYEGSMFHPTAQISQRWLVAMPWIPHVAPSFDAAESNLSFKIQILNINFKIPKFDVIMVISNIQILIKSWVDNHADRKTKSQNVFACNATSIFAFTKFSKQNLKIWYIFKYCSKFSKQKLYFHLFSAPQAENFRNNRHHFINFVYFLLLFKYCFVAIKHKSSWEKNLMKKIQKVVLFWNVQKCYFWESKKSPTKKAPPP